jgi:hypothetical protein
MRSQTSAGCCVTAIIAVVLVPVAWVGLVLTDKEPEYLNCRFREGLGRKQVEELAIWTQWRIGLRRLPPDGYLSPDFDELMRRVQSTISPESWEEACMLCRTMDP